VRSIKQPEKVSTPTIGGYAVGDFGLNLYFTGLNLYLLYYYTDVLGIEPAIAGLIFMIPVIWDGISDPLMGWLAARTHTRFGKFRPYVLFAAPFVGLSFVGMFAAPVWFPEQVIAASLIAHILFRTLYTVVSVPYSSLAAALTYDSEERGTMAAVRMMAAMAGGIFTAASMLEFASYFGAGSLRDGFVLVSVVYAILASVLMAIVFVATAENAMGESPTQLTTGQTLEFVKHNTAFWVLCGASFVGIIGSTIGGKSLVYYISYYANRPDAVSTVISLGIMGACVAIPLWTYVAVRLSKRLVWIIGGCGAALGNLLVFGLQIQDIPVLSALAVINGIFGGAIAVMFWSMLPDTVEYGQWNSGVRDDSIVFGLSQLISKAGTGIGVGTIGLLLSFIGYSANQVQGEATLQGIRQATFLIPFVCILGSVAIIYFYPLDASTHRRIVRALQWRQQRSAS